MQFMPAVGVKSAWELILLHDAQVCESQRLLTVVNLDLDDKAAHRTYELARSNDELAMRLKHLLQS